VELLDLDISTAASKSYNLQSALNFPAQKRQPLELTERQLSWPFDQEIWEDEVDFMRAKNPSKCPSVEKTASRAPGEENLLRMEDLVRAAYLAAPEKPSALPTLSR